MDALLGGTTDALLGGREKWTARCSALDIKQAVSQVPEAVGRLELVR